MRARFTPLANSWVAELMSMSSSFSAACSFDDEKYPWVPPVVSLLRDVGDNFPHVRLIGIWCASASTTCRAAPRFTKIADSDALSFGSGRRSFGLQQLVRAYGGQIGRNPKGWEVCYSFHVALSCRELY